MVLAGFSAVDGLLGAGVYALVFKGEVVYVGKAKGLLNRIYTHRSMWSAQRRKGPVPSWIPVKGILFDEVHICPCALASLDAIEREMINRYKPRHNKLLKDREKIATPIPLTVNGKIVTLNAFCKPKPHERRL